MVNVFFKYAITLFKIAGIGIKKQLIFRTTILVFMVFSINIITNIWGIYKCNFDHFIDAISIITRPCYAIARAIIILIVRKRVIEVISDFDKLRQKFTVEIMNEENILIRKYKWYMLTYYKLLAFFVVLHVLKPFLSGKRELPTFVLNQHEIRDSYFYLIYLYDIGLSCIGMSIYVGWDTLILAMILELTIHLNALKKMLPKAECLSESNCQEICMRSISKCVYYHYKLRRLAYDISNLISKVCLLVFANVTLTICFQLYKIINDGYSSIVYYSYQMFGQSIELFAYCLLGSIFTAQNFSVSEAIYCIDWWDHKYKGMKKSILLMIQHGQRDIAFTILWGIKEINLPCFIMVYKTAFSLSTVLQYIKMKNEIK